MSPQIPSYPDGSPLQVTDKLVAARSGANIYLDGSDFGSVTQTDTETLTNKRVTPRVVNLTAAAEPVYNTDNGDIFRIGVPGDELAVAITSMTTNLSGTPTHGQKMIIEIMDDGTGRAIAWGASFRATDRGTLPTTTMANKLLRAMFMYDSVDSKWDCVAVTEES